MDTERVVIIKVDQKPPPPHVVFIPFPAQSHVKAMLKLAQLLHHKGLQITFVNTDDIHDRLLGSAGSDFGSPDFRFQTIPRGSEDDDDGAAELLLRSVETKFLDPFLELVTKLPTPPTCIVSDGFMSAFTVDAAEKLGVPVMLYWTLSACGFMGLYQIQSLIDKGLTPLKDESYFTNGFLENIVDWIPGMEGIRLKDLPTAIWTTDPNDEAFRFSVEATQKCHKVSRVIVHTFNELEAHIVNALSSMFSGVYTIGPVQLLLDQINAKETQADMSNFNGYSLWKEDPECFQWLQSKEPNSVIYVNYGSTTVMSIEDLVEFGWGLVNSNHYFLWIIRSNLVVGDQSAVLPPELEEQIKIRGFIASWCSQEKVLNHPSVGGFLTHSGWGSTIESLSAGVPMICWPFLWDQPTNCRYICNEWEVGLEMGKNVKRDNVKKLVQELMGEGGERMRNKAMEWKEKAEIATAPNGSSFLNVENLVTEITMLSRN
ncbi:hypothetical protein OSB04_003953 [Centaurea solstitialis]|uniref:Glycosyltransferase n=1 Tax=Centaurea solstitialis TaxID=347529 RepID=A0AA38UCV6_9ASTR|nr:hypothetical protein OSB04_003953 [Centaurea solstitialis]